nr:AraC family transcriptional regulator [Sinomicrobium weinanense]
MIFCEERNIDIQKLAELSGFSIRDLNSKPDFTLSNQQMETLWGNAIQISRDELIGFRFGAAMQLAALNIVGQIIQTSNTVKQALLNASSLIHLFTDFYTMKIEEKEKTFSIVFRKNNKYKNFATSFGQMGDFLVALTVHELKGLLLQQPKPLRVTMPSFKEKWQNDYLEILDCPVRKKEYYALDFDKAYLKTKIITGNYELQQLLLNQVAELKNTFADKGSFSTAIFNYLISNSYLYSLSAESVATNFNISVRTLQRRLKDEGASYIQIVEEVRKTLAIQYLRSDIASVKEISNILGYAEVSGFVRAFKKWTGRSPSLFLENKN